VELVDDGAATVHHEGPRLTRQVPLGDRGIDGPRLRILEDLDVDEVRLIAEMARHSLEHFELRTAGLAGTEAGRGEQHDYGLPPRNSLRDGELSHARGRGADLRAGGAELDRVDRIAHGQVVAARRGGTHRGRGALGVDVESPADSLAAAIG